MSLNHDDFHGSERGERAVERISFLGLCVALRTEKFGYLQLQLFAKQKAILVCIYGQLSKGTDCGVYQIEELNSLFITDASE